jgi:hypothetical protein
MTYKTVPSLVPMHRKLENPADRDVGEIVKKRIQKILRVWRTDEQECSRPGMDRISSRLT